jgi:MFS family permease
VTILRPDDLTAAVEAGIISRDQADALEDLAADRAGRPHASDERFVIVNNFAELFVAIGLLMLLGAGRIAAEAAGATLGGTVVAAGSAVVAWLAAEYFTFRRRMMLPGIVAGLSAVWFAVSAVGAHDGLPVGQVLATQHGQAVLLVALLAIVLRLRIPFLVVPVGLALAGVVISHAGDAVLAAVMLCGLAFLALAVRFDLRDPARLKRQSQFAFWLYVTGSPLAVHPLFFLALGLQRQGAGMPASVVLTIPPLAVIVTLFGLLMDRRSPVISTLGYVAFAVGYLLNASSSSPVFAVATTLALIGVYVVALGIGWRRVRSALFRRLPRSALLDRLPPVSAS